MLRSPARVGAALFGALLLWLQAAPVMAHGGVTGAQDVWQDYGTLMFLGAVVLIGAGVLVWVMLSPQPDEDEDPSATSSTGTGGNTTQP